MRTPSRAVESTIRPADVPRNALFPGSPPGLVEWRFNRNPSSEDLVAYELGYRTEAIKNVTVDTALFYNVYDRLILTDRQIPRVENGLLVLPEYFDNSGGGESYGLETSATWSVTPLWKLTGGYSLTKMDINAKGGTNSLQASITQNTAPQQQFNLRSGYDITPKTSIDVSAYYVDAVPGWNIPGYLRVDTHVSYRPARNVELSVTGQNLLDDAHPEFGPSIYTQASQVRRGVYGKVAWKF